MKIVIINGSARKGNTLAAINAFIKGASEKNHICGSNFINCRICIILIDTSLRALTDTTSLAWCNVEFVRFNDFNFILF